MNRKIWRDNILTLAAVIVCVVFAGVTAFYSPWLAASEACLAAVLIALYLIQTRLSRKRFRKFIIKLSKKMDFTKERVLNAFPFPTVVCSGEGKILWYSEKFINRVIGDRELAQESIDAYTNAKELHEIINSEQSPVFVNGRSYSVFTNSYEQDGETRIVLYYIDNTDLREIEKEYYLSRPSVILIKADNIGDSRFDFRDSERAEIRSMVEAEIENWVSGYNCIMRRLSDTRYIIVAEKRDVDKMLESRFPVLDRVRALKYKNLDIAATLSVGVSDGENLAQCERKARKALEMALNRGGDQVAVASKDSFDFFGGVSKSIEKVGKVQVRVIGSALAELIGASDEVIVMGHKWPDLDVMGAAVGICCAAEAVGVPSYIATNTRQTIASALVDRINSDEFLKEAIINEETALRLMSKKTLLVVVDTHIKSFVEFPEVYKKATTIVVIDHHRKAMDAIDNAVVFHLDPNASSASEMVTELLQYINPEPDISKLTAEALLSGIMLDTKNFVLRAGVRTFEAAAFLKENGADTVNVRKLFANSMETNRLRNQVISQAEEYNGCALSVSDFESEDIRVISSQAADELLNITGVKASFVLYNLGNCVNISARSLGEMNVQVIMELLGGGGHQTMAAAQLAGETVESAKQKLKAAIDSRVNQ